MVGSPDTVRSGMDALIAEKPRAHPHRLDFFGRRPIAFDVIDRRLAEAARAVKDVSKGHLLVRGQSTSFVVAASGVDTYHRDGRSSCSDGLKRLRLKVKSVQRGKFPVIGCVKDPSGVTALYLGKREGKDLVYMGKVGTGWSRTVSSQIRKQLDTVV